MSPHPKKRAPRGKSATGCPSPQLRTEAFSPLQVDETFLTVGTLLRGKGPQSTQRRILTLRAKVTYHRENRSSPSTSSLKPKDKSQETQTERVLQVSTECRFWGGGSVKQGGCHHCAASPFKCPRLSSWDFKRDLRFKKEQSANGPGLPQANVMKKLLRGETFLNAKTR